MYDVTVSIFMLIVCKTIKYEQHSCVCAQLLITIACSTIIPTY